MADLQDPSDTFGRVIAASTVTGTTVFDSAGETLGSIYDVMLDKLSGHVEYAIMNFGGLFGIGEKYHPLPWSMLTYDHGFGGYVVNLDRAQLAAAPAFDAADTESWGGQTWGKRVTDYYGAAPGGDVFPISPADPVLTGAPR